MQNLCNEKKKVFVTIYYINNQIRRIPRLQMELVTLTSAQILL